MSLIADALKAAQQEREAGERLADASRRATAASLLRSGRTVTRLPSRRPRGATKRFGMAAAIAALVLIGSVGALAVASGEGGRAMFQPTANPPSNTATSASIPAATGDPNPSTSSELVDQAGGTSSESNGDSNVALMRGPASSAVPGPVSTLSQAAAPRATQPATGGRQPSVDPARFRIVVQPNGATANDLYQAAVTAHQRNDLGSAVALYLQVLADDPTHAQALANLGAAYQAQGRAADARDVYRRAIDVDVRNAPAWASLGVVLVTLGAHDEAQVALAEAIRLDPSNVGAKVNLANQYLAKGLGEDARGLLEGVLRDQPYHAEAHYALGRVLELNRENAAAVAHYRSFLHYASGRFPELEGRVRERIRTITNGEL